MVNMELDGFICVYIYINLEYLWIGGVPLPVGVVLFIWVQLKNTHIMDIHGPYGKDTEKPQLLIENQREGTFVNGKLT